MWELTDDFSYYRYVGTYFFCHWSVMTRLNDLFAIDNNICQQLKAGHRQLFLQSNHLLVYQQKFSRNYQINGII